MSQQDERQSASHRPTVLVVDDQPSNLAVASAFLAPLDIDIRLAENGETALEYATLPPQPDLILLDVMMPDMDGHVVLARLRADPRTRDIPVIFVTALDSSREEHQGLEEGAVDYITKPLKAPLFQARVRNHLELKIARDRLANQNQILEQEVDRRVIENRQLATRLQMAIQAADLGIWEYRLDTGEMAWDEQLCRMLGIGSGPTGIGATLDLTHPEDRPELEKLMVKPLPLGSDAVVSQFRMQHQDGHWLWLEGRGKVVSTDDAGQPQRVLGTVTDIHERKLAEIEHQLSSIVFTGINDGICITDPSGRIQTVNPAFTRVTGFSAQEAIGQYPSLLKSGIHGPAFYRTLWDTLLRCDAWQGEITNRRKNGELVSEWLSISAVRNATGQLTHFVGLFSDLSERKEAAERIQYLSSFDPLTELPNRNLFADRLGQALINAHRFGRQTAVILLDLDRFRGINESLGPPVGDDILSEVARRLNLLVREGDTVGRRAGNEFGFVMANLSHESDAIALAQRLLEAIAAPITVNGQQLVITASLGISLAPRDGDDPETLLKTADTALARAKEAGRNTFRFYSPAMDADAARRLALDNALHTAMQNDELSLVYQPQVSLDSGNMIGMEALLRWQHPQFGNITPAEFIPLAEENGLIVPIGEWVLHTACVQAKRWHDLGLTEQPLVLSINLSARQFRQANLEQVVSQALARSRLPGNALELEITESAFLSDADQAIQMCRALKKLGVRLALDDFGTGYSSLAYVSRFPFDKIKIDQSFINDIIENPVNAAIATSAIIMARSLNLSVIAEGVETESQAHFLRGRRCDAIQGYLFSRPLVPDEFEHLLSGRKQLPLPDLPSEGEQTLLLVDDESNILNALARLLRREGYRILTASSPLQAFDLLAKQAVQVVLSDQRMPEMSGTEFLSRVRQLYPHTVRIVLTGYTDLDSVTEAVNKGAVYKFLTKPWDDDQLREQIREAFRMAKEIASGRHPANLA